MSDETPSDATDATVPGEMRPDAPPPTFEFLVHTLFTQSLMALGRIPNPITKQSQVNMATARHFVDTLGMLERKTAGNLTTDEQRLLEEVLHQLRMMVLTGDTHA